MAIKLYDRVSDTYTLPKIILVYFINELAGHSSCSIIQVL